MADNDQPLLLPIIDSHIHLWPGAEHDTLAWNTPENPFHKQQRSIAEYKVAGSSSPSLLGYIFIETDRKNNHPDGEATPEDEKKSWEAPLQEIRWMRRLALGEPEGEEGHEAADKKLCLGLVPWAPMVRGPEVLERYLAQAEEAAGEETWKKVKGFRYLVQDKPHGTMLTDEFIGSLKLLGRKGYTFDVGVDHHRRGKKQLEELVEMVGKAHEGIPEDEQVVLILSKSQALRRRDASQLIESLRPPLQARYVDRQHSLRPCLRCLAYGHVHPLQSEQDLHEALWCLLRDARLPAQALRLPLSHLPVHPWLVGYRPSYVRSIAHHVR